MTSVARRIAGKNNAMQADMVSRHPAATKSRPSQQQTEMEPGLVGPFSFFLFFNRSLIVSSF